MKFQSLQDLKLVQKQIAAAQAKAAAEEAARAAAIRKAEADQNLFVRAIGKVAPLPIHNKAHLPSKPREPIATQLKKDEAKVIRAVEFLFAFTLMAGLLVLTAAVTSTREERKREFAIMRALGATGRLLSQVQTAELLGVGLLAGFLASLVAELVGWGLARFVFEFEWTASLWVPAAGALTGAGLAWIAGWWGLAEVLRQPVSQTLRQASE